MISVENKELNANHYADCVDGRGLHPDWIKANCYSITASQATEVLGYPAKSDGILLKDCNYQIQFKPNKPWKTEQDKKAPKYRSRYGEYDAMLPTHPTDPDYWNNIEKLKECAYKIDGHPCLILTEGFFKAIAGCSIHKPSIALLGVDMGLTAKKDDPQGKRYLVPTLEKYAKAGFGFIITFDADCATNPNVADAQKRLASALQRFKVPVYSITGLWSIEEGKGMDDYIQKHDGEQFVYNVLSRAINIDAWEKQFRPEVSEENRDLSPRAIAVELAEDYRGKYQRDNQQKKWYEWYKSWKKVDCKAFENRIYQELKFRQIIYKQNSYLENVIKGLEHELMVEVWKSSDRSKYVAFNNCVLELETGKCLEHAPGFKFKSHLEHDYISTSPLESEADIIEKFRNIAPTCYKFMMELQEGNPKKVLKLLAIANGIIKFKFSRLQMFVLIQGDAGSGKSTLGELYCLMVGEQNFWASKLHTLADDYQKASYIDSQLLICPDERTYKGELGTLLCVSSGGPLTFRLPYGQPGKGVFGGTVIIIANHYPFAGETTGIDRRICPVICNNVVPAEQRDIYLIDKLKAELSQIISVALAMPDQLVTDLIKGVADSEIPDVTKSKWLLKTDKDSLALFLEEGLALCAGVSHPVGNKEDDPYTNLFPAYIRFVVQNNHMHSCTKNTFRKNLMELCKELGLTKVEDVEVKHRRVIKGLRIRRPDIDDHLPRISELLGRGRSDRSDPERPRSDLWSDLKPAPSKDRSDLSDLKGETFKNTQLSLNLPNVVDVVVDVADKSQFSESLGQESPTSLLSALSKDLGSLHRSLQVTPVTPPALSESNLVKGDEVRIKVEGQLKVGIITGLPDENGKVTIQVDEKYYYVPWQQIIPLKPTEKLTPEDQMILDF